MPPGRGRSVTKRSVNRGHVVCTSHAVHHFLPVRTRSPPDRMRNVGINHPACFVSYKLEKDAAGLPFGFLWSLIASPLYHLVSLAPASFISIFENDEPSNVMCPEGDCQNTLNYAVVWYSLSSLSFSFEHCWKNSCSIRLGGQDCFRLGGRLWILHDLKRKPWLVFLCVEALHIVALVLGALWIVPLIPL